MSKTETVEVTLKIPKPLKEFFEAVHKFSKVPFTFEDWCYHLVVFGMKDGLESGDLTSLFPDIESKRLIEAYGLDKVFNFKEDEKN